MPGHLILSCQIDVHNYKKSCCYIKCVTLKTIRDSSSTVVQSWSKKVTFSTNGLLWLHRPFACLLRGTFCFRTELCLVWDGLRDPTGREAARPRSREAVIRWSLVKMPTLKAFLCIMYAGCSLRPICTLLPLLNIWSYFCLFFQRLFHTEVRSNMAK